MLAFYEKAFRVGTRTASYQCGACKKTKKVQVQVACKDKMSILTLVSAQSLEFNIDRELVCFDGLSHTLVYPCQWTKETEQICYHSLAAIHCQTFSWITRISTDDPIWYSFPYHVATF